MFYSIIIIDKVQDHEVTNQQTNKVETCKPQQ